jgi:protein phosphatase 1 regulatory subunit 7
LSTFSNLKILSIQSNRITKMENLEGLVSLEELYLSHNGLTKLEGLEKNVSVLPTGHYDPPIVWVLILTYLL